MIDAIITSVLDEESKEGTIKILTSAPLQENDAKPREKALGGGYTDRQLPNILAETYGGLSWKPTKRAGRESPYRTSFTPDDYAPEHLDGYRTNIQREREKLDGKELRE